MPRGCCRKEGQNTEPSAGARDGPCCHHGNVSHSSTLRPLVLKFSVVLRLLLSEHSGAAAQKMSELQAAALAEEIKTAVLTTEEKAFVAGEIAKIKWTAEAHMEVALHNLSVTAQAPKRRRGTQDFTQIHHYIADSLWEALEEKNAPADVKLQALLQHSMRLGLRNASEPTMKWLTSLWLCLTHDGPQLTKMDCITKGLKLRAVKSVLDNLRRRAPDPPQWVEKLPSKSVELLRDFPVLYKAAFPGSVSPGSPRIDLDMVLSFDLSYGCRGGLKRVISPTATASSPRRGTASLSLDCGNNGFEKFALGVFQTMASQQQAMMQMLQGSPAASSRPLTSIASLAERPFSCGSNGWPHRAPQLAIGGMVGDGRCEELPESPPNKAPSPPLASSAVLAVAQEPSEKVAKVDEGHDGNIAELFGMLQSRSDAKAKAAKAKDVAKDSSKKCKLPTTSKCESKAKATCKTKAKHETATCDALCKAEAKHDKAAIDATCKVKAKHKTPTVERKDAEKVWDESMGYGCSKCRWSAKGCARCKSVDYTGFRWNSSM